MDPIELIMRWLSEEAERGLKSVAVVAFQCAGVVRLVPKGEQEGYRVR